MRGSGERISSSISPRTGAGAELPRAHTDWATLKRLLPYLLQYKLRVAGALIFMVGAKLANVGVPVLLKTLVDRMTLKPGDTAAVLVVPVALLVGYGLLRLSTSLFTELRELVFAKATQGATRTIALRRSSTCTRCRCASTWSARPAA
jgi:ABC-type multidrug transport system fused ATPase/permease subunit